MKRSIISIALLAACGLAAAHGTTGASAVSVGVVSSSSAQAAAGVNGGTSVSVAGNRQSALVAPGSTYAGQVNVLGQAAGAAGVAGAVQTSSGSFAGNVSTGAASGSAAAGGASVASLSAQRGYNAGSSVTGSVQGGTGAASGSLAESGTNGAAGVAVGAQGAFSATAASSRIGVFTTQRDASTTAGASASTTPIQGFTLGNAGYSLNNSATAGAASNAASGSVTSSN